MSLRSAKNRCTVFVVALISQALRNEHSRLEKHDHIRVKRVSERVNTVTAHLIVPTV